MLNTITHQGKANQKANHQGKTKAKLIKERQKLLFHTHNSTYNNIKKNHKDRCVGKDIKKLERLYTADGNGKMVHHLGKHLETPQKLKNYHLTQQFHF